MRKAAVIFVYFSLTPIILLLGGIMLLNYPREEKTNILVNDEKGAVLATAMTQLEYYSALPPEIGTIDHSLSLADARPVLIKNYLEKYNSPLLPYADYIFQVSEEFGLDYGLIVAIAQCESNVCKRIPEGSYNCWGFENGATRFDSWEHAIRRVAQTLKERYYDYGLITPDQIMPKYAPPSVEKGGPWAKCVNQFLEELR